VTGTEGDAEREARLRAALKDRGEKLRKYEDGYAISRGTAIVLRERLAARYAVFWTLDEIEEYLR
jgi:hypothetical protein